QAIVAKVLTTEPAGLATQRRSIPPQVEAAVLTALEKLPADRFATAAEFAAALSGQADGRTVERPRSRTTAPLRHLPASPVLLALLAVALVVAAWGWLRPAPAATTSRQQVTLWHHPLGQFLSPGVVFEGTQAAIAPDGSRCYTGAAGARRRSSSDRGSSHPVQPSTGLRRANLSAFSPLPGSRGVLYTRCPGNCAVESAIYVFDFAADSGRLLVPNAAG